MVPELLPLLGLDPLVERGELFDEVDDLDLDDLDGALATEVL